MITQLTQALDQVEAAQARLERPLSQLLVAVWSDIRELAHGALAEVELTQTVAMQDDDEHPANRFADATEAGQLLELVTVAVFGHFSELDERIEQLEDRQAEVWSAVAVGTA